ncbi:hypothetical protein O3M35_011891 [Rhynocoris fuscipes]|uniref:Phosphagen kinase C-terminal domain-containing protein n=1 Tax=Rhynocoris fuscipes TaxID=488301 RepID=A0AAW1D0I2_9HEMI
MEDYPFNPCLTEAQYKEMEEKVSSTLSGLSGEIKGTYYPLTAVRTYVQGSAVNSNQVLESAVSDTVMYEAMKDIAALHYNNSLENKY